MSELWHAWLAIHLTAGAHSSPPLLFPKLLTRRQKWSGKLMEGLLSGCGAVTLRWPDDTDGCLCCCRDVSASCKEAGKMSIKGFLKRGAPALPLQDPARKSRCPLWASSPSLLCICLWLVLCKVRCLMGKQGSMLQERWWVKFWSFTLKVLMKKT